MAGHPNSRSAHRASDLQHFCAHFSQDETLRMWPALDRSPHQWRCKLPPCPPTRFASTAVRTR